MRLVKGLRAERARWAGRIIATVDVVDCVTTPPWASESIHWALTKPRELTAAITGIDGKLSH